MMKNNIEQLIYGQLKTNRKDEGFITLEVIVALIVGLVFFAVSLQAFGVAVAMKAKSQEKQRANELIQEDIERIGQLGSNSTLAGVCNPQGADLAETYNNGYAHALWTDLIAAVPNLIETVPSGDTPLTKTVSNKIRTPAGTGTGEAVGSIQSGGRTLGLRRFYVSEDGQAANSVNDPHRTLKIGYKVWYWDTVNNTFLNQNGVAPTATDNAIAETYVEVIPDVALSCP